MQTFKKIGVVVMFGDKFWGVQYEDGQSTCYGWGSIQAATISESGCLTKPEDMTYKGSHYVNELKKGKIVEVERSTSFEVRIPETQAQ